MRAFATALVAAGLLAGPGAATVSAAAPDLLAGTGRSIQGTPLGDLPAQIHLDAQSGGGGVDPRGHFWERLTGTPVGDISVAGDLVCLTVTGNIATARGVITESNNTLVPVGAGALYRVVDNGAGPKDPPDEVEGVLQPPPGPNPSCPPVPLLTHPISDGNFVVKDR